MPKYEESTEYGKLRGMIEEFATTAIERLDKLNSRQDALEGELSQYRGTREDLDKLRSELLGLRRELTGYVEKEAANLGNAQKTYLALVGKRANEYLKTAAKTTEERVLKEAKKEIRGEAKAVSDAREKIIKAEERVTLTLQHMDKRIGTAEAAVESFGIENETYRNELKHAVASIVSKADDRIAEADKRFDEIVKRTNTRLDNAAKIIGELRSENETWKKEKEEYIEEKLKAEARGVTALVRTANDKIETVKENINTKIIPEFERKMDSLKEETEARLKNFETEIEAKSEIFNHSLGEAKASISSLESGLAEVSRATETAKQIALQVGSEAEKRTGEVRGEILEKLGESDARKAVEFEDLRSAFTELGGRFGQTEKNFDDFKSYVEEQLAGMRGVIDTEVKEAFYKKKDAVKLERRVDEVHRNQKKLMEDNESALKGIRETLDDSLGKIERFETDMRGVVTSVVAAEMTKMTKYVTKEEFGEKTADLATKEDLQKLQGAQRKELEEVVKELSKRLAEIDRKAEMAKGFE